ncbi:MAG: hypothetical protein GY755_18755 [Chloroflexi bacterium]|nr:hypothetical protein [Chloroflexota bacterium]
MFQSPWIVGIASLFPGLGYLLLKKWKEIFIVWFLLVFSFALYNFSPIDSFLEIFGLRISFLIWIAQIYLAVGSARQKKAIESGELAPAKEVETGDIIIPLDVPRRKRGLYKLEQIMVGQLEIGETLLATILGVDNSQMKIGTSQYLFGLTKDNLIVLSLGMSGKPQTIDRIPLLEVNNIEYKKRLLQDKVSIHIQGQRKPFKVYTNFSFRKEVLEFLEKYKLQQ